MLFKKRMMKIISAFYWILILSSVGRKYYPEIILTNYFDFTVLNIESIIECICLSVGFLIFFLLFAFYKYYLLTIIYFGIFLVLKRWNNEKIDYTDINVSNYYRDLLKGYS